MSNYLQQKQGKVGQGIGAVCLTRSDPDSNGSSKEQGLLEQALESEP